MVVGKCTSASAVTTLVLSTCLLAQVSCTREKAQVAPAKTNVLLVSIDSLRADRLGVHGHQRDTSPTIDRLAREGARFANALSPTSWTLPSHATLLTGLAQRSHGVVNGKDRLAASLPMLPKLFRAAGYETFGIYSGPFLDPEYGFDAGFDRYISCMSEATERAERKDALASSHSDRTNPAIEKAFLSWLEHRNDPRPFFAFVHMWDVHYDYIAPEPYYSMFDPDYTGPLDGTDIVGDGFPIPADPRDVEHLLALYDGEIRYTDDTLGKLLSALGAKSLLDDTIVVVTADHGDEFLEHGLKGHLLTLYEEVIHVPLVFWGPGRIDAGVVVQTPVGLSDVAPTIAELVGLKLPAQVDGRSLVDAIAGRAIEERTVYSELYAIGLRQLVRLAAREGENKTIYEPSGGTWERYDLSDDPGEQRSTPEEVSKDQRAAIGKRARGSQTAISAIQPEERDLDVPSEINEKLRQLGYLGDD